MAYSVPPLPYDYNALEPTIDEATMKLHHDKHHQAYVDNANKALDGTEWADKDVVEVLKNLSSLPADKQGPVRNNAGGHYNHSLFWTWMAPNAGGAPDGRPRRRDQLRLRLLRRLQGPVQGRGRRALRLRLGLAGPRRLRAGDRLHAQPGQPGLGRQDPAAGRSTSGSTPTT